MWAEGGQNYDFEQSVDVGGFGYPVSTYHIMLLIKISLFSFTDIFEGSCHYKLSKKDILSSSWTV